MRFEIGLRMRLVFVAYRARGCSALLPISPKFRVLRESTSVASWPILFVGLVFLAFDHRSAGSSV